MRTIPVEKIRNIGIMAHIDAGKTTTTERILYYTGVTYKIGDVDEGTTETDWMDQEKERGITITAAATQCFWNDYRINVIDTPGHVDFTAEVERSLRVLDGAVIVLCGVAGVQPQTEKVWHQATKYHIPRIAYVNKMDRVGSDFHEVIGQMEKKFNVKTLVLQLPLGREDQFAGVIDLISRRAYRYNGDLLGSEFSEETVSGEAAEEMEVYREHLVERIAGMDLEVMEQVVEEREPSEELLLQAIRRITLEGAGVPVLMGSSFKNKGVQPLLDAIVRFLPSPLDCPPVAGVEPKSGVAALRRPVDDEPLAALVFKIMTDPYMGQLIYFRVYSGTLRLGEVVWNARLGERVRIAKLLKMHANKREEIQEVCAGDIAATVGLKGITTGDTLCDERHPIALANITFPEPVVSTTIEPKLTSEHGKLSEVLEKMTAEDPTLRVFRDTQTGQTILSGMGELHLEVIQERIRREFNLASKLGKPRVAYRETIRKPATAEEKYLRQAAGKSQYGHVVLQMLPWNGTERFRFVNKLDDGQIPGEFIPAVEAGVRESLDVGILAGYPVAGVEVLLIGGSFHEDESTESAYKVAASMACQSAFKQGEPTLMEPVMKVEITVQEEYLGAVMGDFNARGGRVTHMEVKAGLRILEGMVPMAAMFGYASALRTLSQGRANYSLEFASYEVMTTDKMENVLRTQLGIYSIN